MTTWIGDGWCSGVGDERDALIVLKTRDQRRAFSVLIVLMQTRRWRRDSVPRQQMSRTPRIFCGDERNLSKNAKRPNRNVFEIADWRGDDEQRAGHREGRLLYHWRIAPAGPA